MKLTKILFAFIIGMMLFTNASFSSDIGNKELLIENVANVETIKSNYFETVSQKEVPEFVLRSINNMIDSGVTESTISSERATITCITKTKVPANGSTSSYITAKACVDVGGTTIMVFYTSEISYGNSTMLSVSFGVYSSSCRC